KKLLPNTEFNNSYSANAKVTDIDPSLNDIYETTENTCNETDTESQSDDNTSIASILFLPPSIYEFNYSNEKEKNQLAMKQNQRPSSSSLRIDSSN
ncbi:1072_t:CDS:1, partial [Ambispora gerdemannii]